MAKTAEQKAAEKAAKEAAKAAKSTASELVSTTHDCFNGAIETWQTKEGFYVVQTRKAVTTDILTEEEATAKVLEFVNDTMF